jgi:hypothetical protein
MLMALSHYHEEELTYLEVRVLLSEPDQPAPGETVGLDSTCMQALIIFSILTLIPTVSKPQPNPQSQNSRPLPPHHWMWGRKGAFSPDPQDLLSKTVTCTLHVLLRTPEKNNTKIFFETFFKF